MSSNIAIDSALQVTMKAKTDPVGPLLLMSARINKIRQHIIIGVHNYTVTSVCYDLWSSLGQVQNQVTIFF